MSTSEFKNVWNVFFVFIFSSLKIENTCYLLFQDTAPKTTRYKGHQIKIFFSWDSSTYVAWIYNIIVAKKMLSIIYFDFFFSFRTNFHVFSALLESSQVEIDWNIVPMCFDGLTLSQSAIYCNFVACCLKRASRTLVVWVKLALDRFF